MKFRIIKDGGYYREQIKRWWGWENLYFTTERTIEACERNIKRYCDPENGKVVRTYDLEQCEKK